MGGSSGRGFVGIHGESVPDSYRVAARPAGPGIGPVEEEVGAGGRRGRQLAHDAEAN